MSKMTLRKRIALVAVSALGVGLLTVVPANATALAAGDIVDTTLAAGVNSTLVCLQTGAATDPAYPNAIAVGGTLQFTLGGTGLTGYGVVSGPADWSATAAASGFTLDTTGKKMTVSSSTSLNPVLKVTGAGSITVTWYDAAGGSVLETYYITAVASCVSGVNAANSYVQVTDSASNIDTAAAWVTRQTATTQGAAASGTATGLDTSLDVRTNFSNKQEAYIAVRARDAYTANIKATNTGGTSLFMISCDNGARVNSTDFSFYSTSSFAYSTGTANIAVSQPVDGVAATSTCTVSVDGVELAKKTIKWAGDLASIALTASRNGEVGTSTVGRFAYVCKDAAGNSVSCAKGTTSANHTGISNLALTSGTGGVVVTAIAEAASSSTYFGQAFGFGANPYTVESGLMNYTCSDYGTKSISIYGYSAAGVKVTSNALSVACEDAAFDTYTATLDKSSYKKGDVATLTITGKGSGGNTVAYGTTPGAGFSVAMPGMTAVVAPATTDTETVARAGQWVYTYTVNADAEGNYNGAVKIAVGSTSPQYNKALTVPYTVAGSGAVSNTEVLAAIVKLIASINKQIAALQKALTKKK